MSLIARCPTCQTWYKVVPDQLRISGGWVRCGQCAEVFDVSLQLIDAESELPPDPTPADGTELPPDSAAAASALRDGSTRLSGLVTVEPLPSSGDEPLVTSPAAERLPSDGLTDVPWDSAALLIKPSLEADADVETRPKANGEGGRAVAGRRDADADALPRVESVSFMRAVDAGPEPHRRGLRWLWGVLSVLLILGLLLQGVYRERDQLAALKPEFIPALQTLCDLTGCRISPLQRIEALVLDSATFHQVDQETFQLHLVVKNKMQLALALPAVELTLTGLADEPVIRRVFFPTELGARSETVSAGREWSATAHLQVKADTAQPSALGYRLLVFYP